MQSLKLPIPLLITSFFLSACDGEGGGDSITPESLAFNISSAQSLVMKTTEDSVSKSLSFSSDNGVYSITYNDEVENASNAKISSLRIFGNETFVEVTGNSKVSGFYVVQRDNSFLKLNVKGMALHQTESGKVLFADGSIYEPSNQTVKKLESSLDNPLIQTASGNFAIISSYGERGSSYQVFDTETGLRYNVADCNGPRMVAISSERAIVDDCSGDMLVDMTTGERTNIGIHAFNGESLYLGKNVGSYVIEQVSNTKGDWSWNVKHIDLNGHFTSIITDDVNATGECMNCFNKNQELFASNNWVAVKGVNIVTIHDLNTKKTKTILDDLNVLYIDLKGDTLTYVAETRSGKTVNGTYDLVTDISRSHNREVKFTYIESY